MSDAGLPTLVSRADASRALSTGAEARSFHGIKLLLKRAARTRTERLVKREAGWRHMSAWPRSLLAKITRNRANYVEDWRLVFLAYDSCRVQELPSGSVK